MANTFADRTKRFPTDSALRANGWRIAGRPKNAEAIWEKAGQRVKQSEAVETLQAQAEKDVGA